MVFSPIRRGKALGSNCTRFAYLMVQEWSVLYKIKKNSMHLIHNCSLCDHSSHIDTPIYMSTIWDTLYLRTDTKKTHVTMRLDYVFTT